MGFIVFVLFLALCASLAIWLYRRGPLAVPFRAFRALTAVAAIGFFAFWFFESSVTKFTPNSLTVQIINSLPQPLDFYIINKEKKENSPEILVTRHPGKIRPDHYRIEYEDMKNSDEFWVVGFLGKKNLVYFSQHYVPNKNMDQIIEVQNYINQSQKLSARAQREIAAYQAGNQSLSIWVTLCFLLLFMNIVLLFRTK